ncbi:MAG: phospholipase D-like domain-containing protein [Pseudomonadota bacterium]
MSDPIKRIETTHIDEVSRTARGTTQWFAENRNLQGRATHPITHNNRLALFICGEEGFADIAAQIALARESIDLCCWGFDPGMELVRGAGGTWPRGETYGDLLIAAGKRGVRVRLLVWYDRLGSKRARNMPGYSHQTNGWQTRTGSNAADAISAKHSVAMQQEALQKPSLKQVEALRHPDNVFMMAREEYCASWYAAAFSGLLSGITVCKRHGSAKDIAASLERETYQPAGLRQSEIERAGMVHLGTHHQKPILIDYMFEEGRKAVGYVMGLNSVTDYWDTVAHRIDSAQRERSVSDDDGFHFLKPYQDYACRIEGGRALVALYHNFTTAWDRARDDRTHAAANACTTRAYNADCNEVPAALLRRAVAGDSTVQIVRTQPEDQDKSIEDIYFQATDMATLAGGYLYIENQYFQYEEWAQRLMKKRKDVVNAWKRVCAKVGKTVDDMPFMHVFIVIPVPELEQMIPRTFDTLATLGSHQGMTGQVALIAKENQRPPLMVHDQFGTPTEVDVRSAVVLHANDIDKPDHMTLEKTFGLKVSVAMLNTCDLVQSKWCYREIYIHSKLLLVDDGFLTLGSANLNQRSMAVDSEINIATDDPRHARDLRNRIWMQHSGNTISGGGGSRAEIEKAFDDWKKLMRTNRKMKFAISENMKDKKMTGFLLPLEDPRSSTTRLG